MLYTLHEVHLSFTLLPCCDGPMDLPLFWTRTPSSTYKYREIWWRRVKKPTIYNNCIYISYSETSWLLLHNIKWHQPTETWAVLVPVHDDDFLVQHWLLFSLNLTQFTGLNNLALVRVAQVFMPVHFSHFQITDMEKWLFTYSLIYSNPFPAWMLFTSLDSVHNSLVLCWSALYLYYKVSEFLNMICGLIWLHYIKEGSC